ncbi:MAG TPA: sugar ABC transporter ATP-binding protein [Clostridia bacterium]|nr:sugar ABC transporter ATP-binding protein [Clostridia bacterium]HQA98418.1 sugar ABC transporter ATP-binding protein [Clostridia bacterium]HQO55713.1 sugar ABC transporter ATP-binding protein [Clostridia bacterium]
MSPEYVLEMNHITKRYGESTVLSEATLRVRPGEIHALLGENGAGKSTLMNILFGMPVIHTTGGFKGEVLVDGQAASIHSPQAAMTLGIGMVHQEFMLIPGFTITENIKLNRELSRPNLISRILGEELESLDHAAMARDARQALDSVGVSLPENTLVRALPVGYMQFVEIAREIDKTGVKLLVFDEPTAVLTESEADQLIDVMRSIAARGIAIIFITHRLHEVMKAADTVTVLRDGKYVGSKPISQTSLVDLAGMMIGRGQEGIIAVPPRDTALSGRVALSVRGLHVDMPGEMVNGLDLDVMEGEIIGIGGLAGQGKVGLPNGVMGLYPATGGVSLFGEALPLNNPTAALAQGMSMVSEDRRGVGLLLEESIEDNIVFNAIQVKKEFLTRAGVLKIRSARQVRAHARRMIRDLDIRCESPSQLTGTLSGGNQQKVCIARALTMKPRFLFVSEPTRGIDIGAKSLVLDTLVNLNREQGLTIVMVSSELMELRSICDRIVIVAEGRVVDILRPDSPDADFGLAMSGIKAGEEQSV